MPSLRDLTGRLDDDIEVVPDGVAAPADVLAQVKVEGLRRRRRRHRRNTVLAGLALAVVAVPAIALLPSDDSPEDVRVASESDSDEDSAPDSPPTTEDAAEAGDIATTVPVVVTTAVPPPVTEPEVELGPAVTYEREQPTPTTAPPPPPTTAPPPNQPLDASFTSAPTTAAVGQPVTFTVHWADPDATLTYDDFAADDEPLLAQPCTVEQTEGQAQPAGGSGDLSYTHTFDTPGPHVVTVYVATADCNSPYHGEATITASIDVS